MSFTPTRRYFLGVLAAASFAGTAQARETVRFSYQRSSSILMTLKANGRLDERLRGLGLDVDWAMFTNVLPPMDAGAVEFHADVADAIPVFTQAAGAPLTYYAKENPSPAAEAILVHADSPVHSVADLAGRTIGVSKGSGCHYLLVAALQRAGLSIHDVTVAYLQAQDGGPAFQARKLDAWVIWDPFLAITQHETPTRVLADGGGLTQYNRYYMVNTAFVRRHPEVVEAVFGLLAETGRWLKANPREAADLLAPLWGGVDPAIVAVANGRRSYDVQPVRPEGLQEEQQIADLFHSAGLIPQRLVVTDVPIWQPGGRG
jgi:sulfonate transport system substrate-binding protein